MEMNLQLPKDPEHALLAVAAYLKQLRQIQQALPELTEFTDEPLHSRKFMSTTISTKALILAMPEGVPHPRFHLWERVSRIDGGGQYTVVGLQWIDHNTALMECLPPGWHYLLSEIYGITDARELLHREPSHNILPEADLTRTEGVAA